MSHLRNGGNIPFNSSNDAIYYAQKIKNQYFGDSKLFLKLKEVEVLNYLLDAGYKGDDNGRFLDLVISSLVDMGVDIELDVDDLQFEDGGELSIEEIKNKIGREPKYPFDFINGERYKKCFLRESYKKI
jgi:hypothetical protein